MDKRATAAECLLHPWLSRSRQNNLDQYNTDLEHDELQLSKEKEDEVEETTRKFNSKLKIDLNRIGEIPS